MFSQNSNPIQEQDFQNSMSEKSKLELVDYSDKEGSKISEHKTLVEVIVGSDGKDVEVRNEIT